MKNQRELVLLVPDEYDKIFSAYHSVNHKNNNIINKKTFQENMTNAPQATDYHANINKKPLHRITLNLRRFPIIEKKKNFFLEYDNINNTINNKSNSLEGFKPIEDNKIRNKFNIKKENNPLSVKYLSLTEDNNKFDKYFFSLINNKNVSNIIKNKIIFMNNKNLFENNITETKKEYNYNYIKKIFNKDKNQFKKYIEEDSPLAKDILTNEILNRVSKFKTPKKNHNNNYSTSLYNREDKIKSLIITNYRYENDSNINSSNYLKTEKEKEENILPNIKIEKNYNDKEKEKQRILIIHNVFFEWIIDKIIFKYQTNRKYMGYFSLYNKERYFSRNNIKKLLNEEIEYLKKNIFKTEVNNYDLNLSYDFNADIINKINNIGGLVKTYSKSAIQKKNLDKLRKKNNLYIDTEVDNKESLKKKIFNKLVKKIIYKGRNDLLDVKYTHKSNDYKQLDSLVSNINSNKKNNNKFIDYNEFKRFNDINKHNRIIKSSKILMDENFMNYNIYRLDTQKSVDVNMNDNNNLIYDYFRKKNKIIKNNKIYDDYSKGIFKNYPLNNYTNNNSSQKTFINKNFELNLSKIRSKHSIDKTDDSNNNNKNLYESPFKKIVSIDDKIKTIKQKINSMNKNEKEIRNKKKINSDKDTETQTQSFTNVPSNRNKFEEKNEKVKIDNDKNKEKDKNKDKEKSKENNKRFSNSTGAKNTVNDKVDKDDKIKVKDKDKVKNKLEQKNRSDINKKEGGKEMNDSKENKNIDKKDRSINKRNKNRKKTKKSYSKEKSKSKSKERRKNESSKKRKVKKEEENNIKETKENDESEEEEVSENTSKEENSSEEEDKNIKDDKDNNKIKEEKDKINLTTEINKKDEKINNEKNNINDDLNKDKNDSNINSKELEQIKELDSEHNSNNKSDHKSKETDQIKDSDSKHKSNEKRNIIEEIDEYELEKSEENSFNENENNKKEKEKEKGKKKESKKKKKVKTKKKENPKPDETKDINNGMNKDLDKSRNESRRPSIKSPSNFLENFKRPKNKKNNKDGKSSNKSKFSTKKNYPSLPKLKNDKKSSQRRGSIGLLSSAILESLTKGDSNKKKKKDNSDSSGSSLEKKNNKKEKVQEKEKENVDNTQNYKSLNEILNSNEGDLDEQEKLVYYALKMQKLKEANNKSDDLDAERNELKEKYRQIISAYILKQKHQNLIKNKKNKSYKRSKIKTKYEEFSPIKNLDEISSQKKKKQNEIIKKFASYSDDENSDSKGSESGSGSDEANNSGNDSDEIFNKKKSRMKFGNNSQKKPLIYENSYLFKHKKKDIVIRDEIYKILNNKYDEDKNEIKSEEEESESSSSSESKKENMRDYKSKFSKNKYLSKRNSSVKNKKNKNKKKVNRMTMLEKMSLNYTSEEIKDKTDIDKGKNNFDIDENKHLDHRLKYFFSNIQRLKNTKDENTIEKLMKELGVYDIEKRRNRVLSNFFDLIDNFRLTNKLSKSKFNFLPPIKFSTNNLSQKKLDE